MRVTIRGKNLQINTALREYAEKKLLLPLRRLVASSGADLPILDLEFSRTTRHHRKGNIFRAEANLSFGKRLLRAEVAAEDLHAACDMLKDELERELKNLKEKRRSVEKRNARREKRETRFAPEARVQMKGRERNEGN